MTDQLAITLSPLALPNQEAFPNESILTIQEHENAWNCILMDLSENQALAWEL